MATFDKLPYGGQTDQKINDTFHDRPSANKKINNVPVSPLRQQHLKSDKTPVNASDEQENFCHFAQRSTASIHIELVKI